MRKGAFSRTALAACALRAVHREQDQPCLLDDPHAVRLLHDADHAIAKLPPWVHALDRRGLRILHGARGHIVARTLWAEELLQQAVAAGQAHQYLILGAGLDIFAWRRPDWAADLPVIEIDHPDTQAEKKARALRLGSPGPHRYLPVDFRGDSLRCALAADPSLSQRPSLVSWLGVTPYLPWETVLKTLMDLHAVLAPGSRLVFDFAEDFRRLPRMQLATLGAALMAVGVAARGERFYNHRRDLAGLQGAWRVTGWQPEQVLDEAAVNLRFFGTQPDGLRTIPGTGLACLIRP